MEFSTHLKVAPNLEDFLLKLTSKGRLLSIAEFMALISQHPLGYYSNRNIGQDFITAPKISGFFSKAIGKFIDKFLEENFLGVNVRLIELGPGSGDLMFGILKSLSTKNITRLSISLVETSGLQNAMAMKKLGEFGPLIAWHKDLGAIAIKEPIILVANEFCDALPIHQILIENYIVEGEVCVSNIEGKLGLCINKNVPDRLRNMAGHFKIKDGLVEISPASTNIARYINSILEKFGGLSLIIDYGNWGQVGKSSLQSIYQHQKCGIFDHIGRADISAHVDFKAFAEVFAMQKEFFTQAKFLKTLGIQTLSEDISDKFNIDCLLDSAHPESMGELFKVLVCTKI